MMKRLVLLDADGNRLASLEPVQDSRTAVYVESLKRAIRGDVDKWLYEVVKMIDFTKVRSVRVEDIIPRGFKHDILIEYDFVEPQTVESIMVEVVISEVAKHREIVLSVLVNAIKYRWERIVSLEIAVARFEEGTDAESQSDTGKLVEQLTRHRDRFAEVQKAFAWLWLDWRGRAISLETVNDCEPETAIEILIGTYPELIDESEKQVLLLGKKE